MWLTVPEMSRVRSVPVKTAPADDDPVLDRGALHVSGTGFPWEEGSNVYIAGHRLGYLGTGSYLLFFDLPELERGDEVLLRDAHGERYRYRVFRKLEVGPEEIAVTHPVRGKSVVSLQTCTLPDYAHRIVVQAERVEEELRT
jgi:sortase A